MEPSLEDQDPSQPVVGNSALIASDFGVPGRG